MERIACSPRVTPGASHSNAGLSPKAAIMNRPNHRQVVVWEQGIVMAVCTRHRAGRPEKCPEEALVQSCDFGWGDLVLESASTDHTPGIH